jgi:hypothetical protein
MQRGGTGLSQNLREDNILQMTVLLVVVQSEDVKSRNSPFVVVQYLTIFYYE